MLHDRVTVVAPVVRGARPLSFQVTQKLPRLVAAAAAQLPDVRVVSNTNQPPPGQAGQRKRGLTRPPDLRLDATPRLFGCTRDFDSRDQAAGQVRLKIVLPGGQPFRSMIRNSPRNGSRRSRAHCSYGQGPHHPAAGPRTNSLAAAWAASSALTAVYAPAEPARRAQLPEPPGAEQSPAKTARDTFTRAVEHGDAHVIKFADTAVEVFTRTGNPDAIAAALRAAQLIEP